MRRPLAALTLALILWPVGCSRGSEPAGIGTSLGDAAAPGFPVEVEGVLVTAFPQRIVSASASHTEILYALGAGDRVVGTDQFSNYPPEAQSTAKLDGFNLGVEAVAVLDPDLVILAFDPGEVQEGLVGLGVPTLVFAPPVTLDDAYAQVLSVGKAAGVTGEAEALVAWMRDEIGAVRARVPSAGPAPTYYYELDPTLYSLTSETFIGGLLTMLGLENVADRADSAGTAYPQLSAEYLLAADPEFIFLADTRCCGQSAATVASRPGWSSLTAVSEGRVVELDDDVASRWGPRLVDLVSLVVAAVYGPEVGE